ncbi:MAG: DUF3316 domain-containing protein [Prevotella sp.]|nr:DUF3316 domain-containing protein [Bacteroides sp.]MCM1366298.1 DUF3316 domain-containing protein [Prevotella sp.]MCM1437102.1 DUF3316 domain-containing protein [Prevotella sp.]
MCLIDNISAKTSLLIVFMILSISARGGCVSECDSVSRPVTQTYSIEIGGVSNLDTYISPLRYHGSSIALSGTWAKCMAFDAKNWTMQFDAYLSFDRSFNKHHSADLYGLDFNFRWGINRRWQMVRKLQLSVGATVGLDVGALYLPRNSNNPANISASTDLSLRASVSYPLKIGRLPILISETVSLPSLAVFFSPQYGEPYYEIYLGNHSGLAHFGWWGNHFGIDNLLSFDLDFGRTAMRLGYRFNVRSSFVNSINHQNVIHAFVIGVIPHGLGLKRRMSCKTTSINALY